MKLFRRCTSLIIILIPLLLISCSKDNSDEDLIIGNKIQNPSKFFLKKSLKERVEEDARFKDMHKTKSQLIHVQKVRKYFSNNYDIISEVTQTVTLPIIIPKPQVKESYESYSLGFNLTTQDFYKYINVKESANGEAWIITSPSLMIQILEITLFHLSRQDNSILTIIVDAQEGPVKIKKRKCRNTRVQPASISYSFQKNKPINFKVESDLNNWIINESQGFIILQFCDIKMYEQYLKEVKSKITFKEIN